VPAVRRADRDKVVVIGAGLGGLAAAICLAHAGLDVTVVDRLKTPGGKLRAVPSAAGPVDAGPTVLTLRAVFDALFAHVGACLSDHLTLVPEPVLARHWWPDGSTLDLHADPAASEAAIRDLSGPRSAAEFRTFHARAGRLYAAFDAPMMQAPDPDPLVISRAVLRRPSLLADMAPSRTLAASLEAQFRDPRLRQLFGRYATYLGGSPYASPALLALIWRAEAGGVWRIPGGMHRLAGALQDLATMEVVGER
jgi:1-hydroxycarotenoid 3,4-desaturase